MQNLEPLRTGARALAIAATLFTAAPARAWQCNRVPDNNGQPSGSSLVWPSRQISYQFNQGGTYQLDANTAFNAVRQAFNNWQSSSLRPTEPAGCPTSLADPNATSTDLTFVEGPQTSQDFVGYSILNPNINLNLVVFRDGSWAYPLTGGETADYMAMTTVTFNKQSGQILDADMEFNSFGYRFTVDDTNVLWDLENVATHEVGHFLGFAHSTDANATMYQTAMLGETSKRLLSCDDAVGLWFRFPTGQSAMTCPGGQLSDTCGQCVASQPLQSTPGATIVRTHDGRGGCQCQGTQGLEGGGWAGLALLLRRVRRRLRPGQRRPGPFCRAPEGAGLSPGRKGW